MSLITGLISNRSPQRLTKERRDPGTQRKKGTDKKREIKIKAASIPTPPPFGSSLEWELRLLGTSLIPIILPNLIIPHAPRDPDRKPKNK